MTLQENLKALLNEKPENREELMGKLMKEQAPKFDRRNPHVIGETLTPFQAECMTQLTDRPQSSAQIGEKIGKAPNPVSTTLAALAAAGKCQRERVGTTKSGNTYWVFWK